MKLKHFLLGAAVSVFSVGQMMAANPNATVDQVRIYINPGHGTYGEGDRHMATMKHGAADYTDTAGFFESNTNMQKAYGLLDKLKEYGVPYNASKPITGTNQTNIRMSHATTGISPELSVVAQEAQSMNADVFISIHSNANQGDANNPSGHTNFNQLLFLYRGYDTSPKNAGSYELAMACWPHAISNKHMHWNWLTDPTKPYNVGSSYYEGATSFPGREYYPQNKKDAEGNPYWIKGDWTFQPSWGTQGYGVLRHNIPGFLVEGYDHTYRPALHRAMNDDVCRHEGEMYARGLNDYFGWGKKDSYGKIYGIVRDQSETMNYTYYSVIQNPTHDANKYIDPIDNKKPLNNVTVTLYNSNGVAVDTYTTDDEWNGAYFFKKVAPGTYTIKHSLLGYKEVVKEVTVTANETNYVDIDMRSYPETDAVQGHYAYGLKLTKVDDETYTASFNSTGDMSNGKIILTNSSNGEKRIIETGAIKKGANSVKIDATKLGDGVKYTWAVAFDNPVSPACNLVHSDKSITYNNGSADARIGLAIDNDQTSANFGTIYTLTAMGQGLQKFNPDFSKNGGKLITGMFGQDTQGSSQYKYERSNRLEVNGGKVYIANYANSTYQGIWEYNPSTGASPTKVSGSNTYYERAIAFYGEGSNRKAFSSHNSAYNVSRFDIGTNTSWQANSPSAYYTAANVLDNGDGDIIVTNNAVIVSQSRFKGLNQSNNPAFVVLDHNMALKYKSDVINSTLNGSVRGGIALTSDYKTFAIADARPDGTNESINIQIYSVSWNGSTPTFTHQYTIPLSGTYQVDQMEFDHASNLIIASQQQGLLMYAIKNPSRQTTTDGSGTITGVKPRHLYMVGNTDAIGNWDPAKAVEFTNNGQNYTITLGENVEEFKISTGKGETSGDWTAFDAGNLTTNDAITNGGTINLIAQHSYSNFVLPWAGVWNITVSGDLSTLTATTSTPRPLYIVGNTEELGAWDTEKAIKVAHDGKNYTITLDENVTAFKISTSKGDETTFNSGNLAISDAITNGKTVNLVANKDGGNIDLPWAGVWTINVANDLSTLTATTTTLKPLTPLYIVGNTEELGAWNTENAVEVSNDRINYSITLDESVTAFKISTNKGDETTFNNGNLAVSNPIANGVKVNLIADAEGSRIALPWAGVWDITIAGDLSTLTATTSTPRPLGSLYIVGGSYAIGNWNPNKAVEIGNDGENYTITLNVPATEFKLSTNRGDWGAFDAGNLTANDAITNGGAVNLIAQHSYSNFVLPWEGEWNITITRDLSTLTATTTTPSPYDGPGIGPEPENAPNPDAIPGESEEAEDAQTEGYFAYDLQSSLSNNVYTFSFKSTGARKNGRIVLKNKSTGAETEIKTKIDKGPNNVEINAYDIQKGDYTWAVKINNNANSTVTQVNSNADIVQGSGRIGVAIDNDQTSKNFGAIYTITGTGKGLQRFNADMSKNGSMILTNQFGLESGTTYRSNRLEVNQGKVYIANFAANNPGVWMYDPTGSATAEKVSGNTLYERAIAFYGEGANRIAFGSHNLSQHVQRFNVGNNKTWTSGSPAKSFFDDNVLKNGDGDILVTDNAVIVSQCRYSGNNLAQNPAFAVFDHDLNLKYKSNAINGTLNGSSNGGMAITPDYKTFAIINSYTENSPADLSVQVYSVSWNGSTPTFTHQYSFKLSGTRQVDQMEFDHAGNLLIASREKGLLKWAVKTSARTTITNARSEFTISGLGRDVAPSNVVATRKCNGEGDNSAAGTVDSEITWTGEAGDYMIYYQTMRRDASGNRVYDNNGKWDKAGTATIASGSTTGKFTHKNLAAGSDYNRIYNYKVANYYPAASYESTKKFMEISGKGRTVTSAVSTLPVNVAFGQRTEEKDGITLSSLDLELNIELNKNVFNTTLLDDNDELVKATKYVVVVDAATAKLLNRASNVDEVGRFYRGTATMTANNCNHYDINDWYMVVDFEDVTPADDLSKATKTLVWKDVELDHTYKPQVYTSAVRTFNFTSSNPESVACKIEVPSIQWTANSNDGSGIGNVAEAIPVKGDVIETLAGNEDYPMGTFQKIGDLENPTNPIEMTKANMIGATGHIDPLPVTDDVLNEWDITYTLILKDKDGKVVTEAVQESNATNKELYSNTQKRIVDILGLNVGRNETTTPDGRVRYEYNAEKNDAYTLVVRTTYRKTINGEPVEKIFENEAPITVNPSFPDPVIDPYKTPGYVFLETGTHWDVNCKDENGEYINDGYFKYYYDVVMDVTWEPFNDNMVRYMGYYGKGKDCIGHPVESNIWTPYQSASILTDLEVLYYNKRATNDFKVEKTLFNGIGYTKGATNWSTLLAEEGHIPVKVHYAWAGNEKLTEVNNAAVTWELSANYPVVICDEPMIKVSTTANDDIHDISAPQTRSRSAVGGKDLVVIATTNQKYTSMVMDDIVENNDITTGVEDVSNGEGGLRLYPNPASSMVTLQAPVTMSDVKIFSIDGQLVKEFDVNDTKARLNVSDLTNGVYIVHAAGTSTRLIKK